MEKGNDEMKLHKYELDAKARRRFVEQLEQFHAMEVRKIKEMGANKLVAQIVAKHSSDYKGDKINPSTPAPAVEKLDQSRVLEELRTIPEDARNDVELISSQANVYPILAYEEYLRMERDIVNTIIELMLSSTEGTGTTGQR
jgi:NACalpha-BTF3-like transcription factor